MKGSYFRDNIQERNNVDLFLNRILIEWSKRSRKINVILAREASFTDKWEMRCTSIAALNNHG